MHWNQKEEVVWADQLTGLKCSEIFCWWGGGWESVSLSSVSFRLSFENEAFQLLTSFCAVLFRSFHFVYQPLHQCQTTCSASFNPLEEHLSWRYVFIDSSVPECRQALDFRRINCGQLCLSLYVALDSISLVRFFFLAQVTKHWIRLTPSSQGLMLLVLISCVFLFFFVLTFWRCSIPCFSFDLNPNAQSVLCCFLPMLFLLLSFSVSSPPSRAPFPFPSCSSSSFCYS